MISTGAFGKNNMKGSKLCSYLILFFLVVIIANPAFSHDRPPSHYPMTIAAFAANNPATAWLNH